MKRLALLLGLLLSACGKPVSPPYSLESFVFGTRVQLSIWGVPEAKARQAAAAVMADLDRLHIKLHAWKPGPVTQLNQALAGSRTPQAIDAELEQLLSLSQDYAARADNLFNPAIGKLVAAWGFHADQFAPQRPSPQTLATLLQAAPSMKDLHIESHQVSNSNPALQLDFGGIAKGWALDREIDSLRQHGISNALLNIGGNVRAIGKKGDQAWRVGLQHPRQSGPMAWLELHDGEAIGTSGDYQRYFDLDGQRYCHLLDPRTGLPAQGMQAATVLVGNMSDAGARSDAATKPLFIDGVSNAMRHAAKFDLNWIVLIDAHGKVYASRAAKQRLHWQGDAPSVQLLD